MKMNLNKENTNQIIKIVVIAIILLVALLNISSLWNGFKVFLNIISPFLWGLAIAFILNIFMTLYENKLFKIGQDKKKRGIRDDKKSKGKSNIKKNRFDRPFAIFLSIITIIAIIGIILILIIPQFVDVITNLIRNIPNFLEDLKNFAMDLTEKFPEANNFIQNINIDTEALRNGIMNLSLDVLDITINQVSGIITGFVNFIIAVIFAIYILANKEELKLQAKKFIYARLDKEKADHVIKVSRLARDSFRSFLTGQAKEAVILGSLCAIGMLILNIPYAGPIGALTALTAFIPIVGAFISGSTLR